MQAALFEAAVLSEKPRSMRHVRVCWVMLSEGRSMADDVLINKAAAIERCVARVRQEYASNPATFASDYTRQTQPFSTFNAPAKPRWTWVNTLIRREKLGVPQSARDVFSLLAQGGWISPAQADGLKRMVGFRNIAVHDYQALQCPFC